MKTQIIYKSKARIYFADGRVEHFNKQEFARALWLAPPKGTRAAFKGINDERPFLLWDFIDRKEEVQNET